ncbi:hypothetical protein [Streptomyces sp. MAR4 CNX-425]|uniref:hypothetical protein n=1 Tax=Streptomyces sp. MAR4 CNX-425 TaxID=3406343 RepID=UPI003B50CB82
MDNGGTERIREALADLCEPLHDVFAQAGASKILKPPDEADGDHQDEADSDEVPDFSGPEYGWFRTHAVRAHAHFYLSRRNLDPWTLAGNHKRNGELWLANGAFELRILHGVANDIPKPGYNLARRAYYRNRPLGGTPLFGVQETIPGLEHHRLLILWHVGPTGEPALRVVRPIGDVMTGRRVPVDVDFTLPPTAAELEQMQFDPSDDDIFLNIADEEEGNDFGAGGISG